LIIVSIQSTFLNTLFYLALTLKEESFENCVVVFPLNFEDGSGRKYTQDIRLVISLINGEIYAEARTYKRPELIKK